MEMTLKRMGRGGTTREEMARGIVSAIMELMGEKEREVRMGKAISEKKENESTI